MSEQKAQKKHVMIEELVDFVLNQNQIEKHHIEQNYLFLLRMENQTIGPLWDQHLVRYLADHTLAPEILVKRLDQKNWVPIYDHPRFTRRKPQVIRQKLPTEKSIYYLHTGVKTGPLSTSDLQGLLKNKKILITTLISIDGGHSWIPMYEYPDFDRRTMHLNDQLPQNVPQNIEDITLPVIDNKAKVEQQIAGDTLANLVLISPKITASKNNKDQEEKPEKETNFTIISIFIISIILIGFFLFHSQRKKNISLSQSITIEQPTPAAQMTPTVNKNITKKKIAPRIPKVPMPTTQPKTRRARLIEKQKQTPSTSYYDDNEYNTPLEQDPVGRELSRKTINREREDELDGERSKARSRRQTRKKASSDYDSYADYDEADDRYDRELISDDEFTSYGVVEKEKENFIRRLKSAIEEDELPYEDLPSQEYNEVFQEDRDNLFYD